MKDKGNKADAWLEAYDPTENDWCVVCEAYLILIGDKCLIDNIDTPKKYRRQGFATYLVQELQNRFENVMPIGIKSTIEAIGFWKSLNLEDGLGSNEAGF